jgi:hypothetical protein
MEKNERVGAERARTLSVNAHTSYSHVVMSSKEGVPDRSTSTPLWCQSSVAAVTGPRGGPLGDMVTSSSSNDRRKRST